MSYASQLSLFEELGSNTHGGELNLGKRKVARPIGVKRSNHVVLKSSKAVGKSSFLQKEHSKFIRRVLPRLAKKFGVIVYEWANSGNHIHLLIKPRSRDAFKGFVSALSGRVAQEVTGSRKGSPSAEKFFDSIPFSRIVTWEEIPSGASPTSIFAKSSILRKLDYDPGS